MPRSYVAAAVVLLLALAAALAAKRRHRATTVDVALAVVVVVILGLTLRPLGDAHRVRPRPLADIVETFTPPLRSDLLLALAGNIAIFVPLGALFGLRHVPWLRAITFGALLSISIEIAQLAVPGRTTSFDDVLLNTAGTALGFGLAALRR
jgi:glycopeptide antibiotics resistance protein